MWVQPTSLCDDTVAWGWVRPTSLPGDPVAMKLILGPVQLAHPPPFHTLHNGSHPRIPWAWGWGWPGMQWPGGEFGQPACLVIQWPGGGVSQPGCLVRQLSGGRIGQSDCLVI